ncbi:MAG: ABC transporter permease [Oscillospiraceae bacterium]|nr:ABC transporter permease [Oscillospiraceae bacterium]
MLLIENIKLAFEGLFANKVRALLTMLGIIIGIGSVLAIVTVGNSMSASVTSDMSSFGVSNINVRVTQRNSDRHMPSSSLNENDYITDEMLESFLNMHGEKVESVSVSKSGGPGTAREGRKYANVNIIGVNDGYGAVNNVAVQNGRFLRTDDIKSRRYVAVVSDRLTENIFSKDVDPLGKEVRIDDGLGIQTYLIVGVYKYEEGPFAAFRMFMGPRSEETTDLYIPVSTQQLNSSSVSGYQSFTVMANSDTDSIAFSETVKDFFNAYYKNNARCEVSANAMETSMETVNSMMGTMQLAIAVIAGISLLVGGIGVMNIMLVSVMERTREIGTRKALGARNAAIRMQFIVEAVIICGVGGVIGVVLGFAGGYAGSLALGFPGLPSAGTVVLAVLFSMAIGVFFGYYPANKAAKLDPIEALRYE